MELEPDENRTGKTRNSRQNELISKESPIGKRTEKAETFEKGRN